MASVQKAQKFDYETVSEIFIKFGPDIRKEINTRNIIPAMHKSLSDADLQPMECVCKNEGPIRAADELMEAVKRKPKSFVHFIYTVYKEGHSDIVNKIRDYLWKRHTTLLTHLDEKLQKKGLKIKSKNVMVVEPLGPQASCTTPLPVLPPVMAHPLQPHIGQGQPQFGREPAAIGTEHQPVHSPTVQSQREVPKLPADVQPNPVHFPGTTAVQHSTDIVLTEIPYGLFSELSEELCRRDPSNWMKLAKAFTFLKRIDVKNIEKAKDPGEALLDKLGDNGCTVSELAKALESAGLQNELAILQEHYANLNSQQQQEPVLNQSQSSSATGQSFSEQSQNIDENNLNMAVEQSIKREVGTKNLNIPGDARTEISKALDTLNLPDSQTRIVPQAVPEPQQEPSVDVPMTVCLVAESLSIDDNAEELLMRNNQHSQRMLNTTSEGQYRENVTDSNPTEVEDDPLGKSALHNVDIDRLHLKQEVHQQDHQQDLQNTSLNCSFKDIHNHPGHVTMQMDSQLRNDAETS